MQTLSSVGFALCINYTNLYDNEQNIYIKENHMNVSDVFNFDVLLIHIMYSILMYYCSYCQ